jgi:hypothetical protein
MAATDRGSMAASAGVEKAGQVKTGLLFIIQVSLF